MKTKEVAARLKVTGATIRIWTGKDGPFVEFMSESGRGGTGRPREFTDRDLRIMAAINDMSNRGMDREQIRDELVDMRAAGWLDLPPVPVPDGYAPSDMVPMVPKEQVLIEIQRKDERIGDLTEELTTERQAHDKTRGELAATKQELGVAQGELKAAGRERKLYIYVIAGVAVAAAVLLAIVLLLALGGGGM